MRNILVKSGHLCTGYGEKVAESGYLCMDFGETSIHKYSDFTKNFEKHVSLDCAFLGERLGERAPAGSVRETHEAVRV